MRLILDHPVVYVITAGGLIRYGLGSCCWTGQLITHNGRDLLLGAALAGDGLFTSVVGCGMLAVAGCGCDCLMPADCRRGPIIGSPPVKSPRRTKSVPPGRPPDGADFYRKLSAEETFLGGRSYNWKRLLWGRRYSNKEETCQFRDYLSPGGFFMGETFYCGTSHTH